jgi:preprotein translocase subunit SecF
MSDDPNVARRITVAKWTVVIVIAIVSLMIGPELSGWGKALYIGLMIGFIAGGYVAEFWYRRRN